MDEKITKPTMKGSTARVILPNFDETLDAFVCDAPSIRIDRFDYKTPCEAIYSQWNKLYCPREMYEACKFRLKGEKPCPKP